jgi:hypothetical protein
MLIAIALALAAATQAPTAEPSSVTVSGNGVVTVAPDQAWVRIGSEARSKDSQDAQQRNAELMTAVQQKLAALGLPTDAIRTIGIDLQLEFDYRDGRQRPRGYVARNTIEVRVDDLAQLGAVLDAAVGSGATQMHGLRFDVKNRDAVEEQALQRAVTNGLAKAQSMAAAAKRTVDRVLRIEEQLVGGGGPQPMFERAMMAKAADTPTPVAAGEIEIRAQVRITATLRP